MGSPALIFHHALSLVINHYDHNDDGHGCGDDDGGGCGGDDDDDHGHDDYNDGDGWPRPWAF